METAIRTCHHISRVLVRYGYSINSGLLGVSGYKQGPIPAQAATKMPITLLRLTLGLALLGLAIGHG